MKYKEKIELGDLGCVRNEYPSSLYRKEIEIRKEGNIKYIFGMYFEDEKIKNIVDKYYLENFGIYKGKIKKCI